VFAAGPELFKRICIIQDFFLETVELIGAVRQNSPYAWALCFVIL
jgi:hypothetical protein